VPDGSAPSPERRVHLAFASAALPLLDELRRVFPGSRHAARSAYSCESDLAPEDAALEASLAFATQSLPAAEAVVAPSVKKWVSAILDRMGERLDEIEGPVRLHVYRVGPASSDPVPRRCRLIEEDLRARLHKKRRSLLRRLVAPDAPVSAAGEALVQAALETPDAGLVSIATPGVRHRLRRTISRFPAGLVRVAADRRPPSRAFRKLLEAEAHLGRPIASGERCVDLGASPGSWSFVALERGASVVAVDRSPLRDDLMSHERVTFVEGDAFRFEPENPPADWLLSDVVAFPRRIVDLAGRWLGEGLCRRFVLTMKFRGSADYPVIESLKSVLALFGAEFQVRQLLENKNEVTAYGTARQGQG